MTEYTPFDLGKLNLSKKDEKAFQQWFAMDPAMLQFRQEIFRDYGEQVSPENPEYDYRRAWATGSADAQRVDDGRLHLGSAASQAPYAAPVWLKQPEHPTRWMELFYGPYGMDPAQTVPGLSVLSAMKAKR